MPQPTDAEVPVVGPREPCPCGSGKRYKACHGKKSRAQSAPFVARPFEGLPGETDWVALREIVPAGTARVRTTAAHGAAEVTIATVLPMAWAAVRRDDDEVLVATQTMSSSGDASRDMAAALLEALAAPTGTPIPDVGLPGPGPRLQDVLDLSVPFVATVEEDFGFWRSADVEETDDLRDSLARASESIIPTVRVDTADSAFWCRIGDREFLRWVMPHDEEALLDALSRLHVRRESALTEDSRLVGAFRTSGLMVPVWELAPGTEADDMADPVTRFAERLDGVLGDPDPLTAEERRARAGLVSRQLTLR